MLIKLAIYYDPGGVMAVIAMLSARISVGVPPMTSGVFRL